MKIFLTGASGFLGHALLKALAKNDYQIACYCRRKPAIISENVEWVKGDLENRFFDGMFNNVDTIIHVAALTHSYNESKLVEINVSATANLIEEARKAGVKKIIYISTASVKAGQSYYSKTKRDAELLITKSGMDFFILRPTWIFSRKNDPIIKKIVRWAGFGFVPVVGKGENKFQPVWRRDVVEIILAILRLANFGGKTYEIGGSEILDYNLIVDTLANAYGKSVRKIHIPKFIIAPLYYLRLLPPEINFVDFGKDKIVDNTNIKKDFNFSPKGFREILLKSDN